MRELTAALIKIAPPNYWPEPGFRHELRAGTSGYGKTQGFIYSMRQSLLASPRRGLHCIDPESDIVAGLLQFVARHTPHRRVHVLNPCDTTRTFGLPLLHVRDRNPLKCHNASLRAVAVFQQSVSFNTGEIGPRTNTWLQLGFFAAALKGLPPIAISEMFNGPNATREVLAAAMPYNFLAAAFHEINALSPKQRSEQLEAIRNRMFVIFPSEITRRIFGQTGDRCIDMRAILERGDIVLLPLGDEDLESRDAVLIGTAYLSILYAEALKRPLEGTVPVDVYADEFNDYVTADVARAFDRLRKRSVYFRIAIQRFSQLLKPNDPGGQTLSAIMTNSRCKIIQGGMLPDDCEFVARALFSGHVEANTIYKSNSFRPTLTGHRKIMLTARADAQHQAETVARGRSESQSESEMHAIADATASGFGSSHSIGNGSSLAFLPDGTLMSPATQLSTNYANNRARGTSHSNSHSTSHVAAHQSARAHSLSSSAARASGRSQAISNNEAMLPVLELLESESYSHAEKLDALAGLVASMPPRAALVKVDGNAPLYVEQTPELVPVFRSAAFRDQAMAYFFAKLNRDMPPVPADVVDREIAAVLAELIEPPVEEPDFAAGEPIPLNRRRRG